MNATIDKAGRLVVPKAIREAAQLGPGTEVRLRVVSGRVEIEPIPVSVTLKREGSFVVAVPDRDLPTMKASVVEEVTEAIRGSGFTTGPVD